LSSWRERRLEEILEIPIRRRRHGDGPQALGLDQELQHPLLELLEAAGPEQIGLAWSTEIGPG